MLNYLLGCCTNRFKEPEEPKDIKDTRYKFFSVFEKCDNSLRFRQFSKELNLKIMVRKIRLASHKGSISYRNMKGIVEECTVGEDHCMIPKSTKNILQFLSLSYFTLSRNYDSESLKLLDTPKVVLFLILYCHESKLHKISCFMDLIQGEPKIDESYSRDCTEKDISFNENVGDAQYHKDDPFILEILSLIFSNAILPFISSCNVEYDDDFERFELFCTTNIRIFFDFARFICKNYLFKNNKESERKIQKLTKREFQKRIDDHFNLIFNPKQIRIKFMMFVNRHQDRALSRISERQPAFKRVDSSDILNNEVYKTNNDHQEHLKAHIGLTKSSKDLSRILSSQDNYIMFTESDVFQDINQEIQIDVDSPSPIRPSMYNKIDKNDYEQKNYKINDEEDKQSDDLDMNYTEFKSDESFNIQRKSNISIDLDQSPSPIVNPKKAQKLHKNEEAASIHIGCENHCEKYIVNGQQMCKIDGGKILESEDQAQLEVHDYGKNNKLSNVTH
ncbi:unnamed protein product [Moneuplotes crassus]|uniref:Uncharacterized protein n=1 Tax=Euplotes crassus TaxID=5936 RepID=A0AAD1U7U9_EUPCR|nr:unnamed protein product [Moneuplotes crassus]